MKRLYKLLWVPVLVLLLITLSVTAFAAYDGSEETATAYRDEQVVYTQASSYALLDPYVDDGLVTYLLDQFANCKKEISLSRFGIPHGEALENMLMDYIFSEIPEAFHVYSLSVNCDGAQVTKLVVEYYAFADTVSEYKTCSGEINVAAEKILYGILGNDALTDVEKALLIHDRLALWVEYGGEDVETAYCMYGALSQKVAVCQGYTMAYTYLLEQVGIESDFCGSRAMNHCWNLVYIDGKPYHVDVTWDDPSCDDGVVMHRNFLLSTQGIIDSGHDGGDFITTPNDATYDDYYWQDSRTTFLLLDSGIYFLNEEDATIRRVDGTQITTLTSIDDRWPFEDGWTALNLEYIAGLKNMVLYSQRDGIYAYDVGTKMHALVFAPDLSESEYLYVCDFKYEDGYLICGLRNGTDAADATIDRQVREPFALSDESYTVTFLDHDGSVLSTGTYTYGQVPVQPTIQNYEDINGHIECWDRPVTVCRGDAVYQRSWRQTDRFKVEFRNWDGTLLQVSWFEMGEQLKYPDVTPEREPDERNTYHFVRWETPADYCTGEMVIYAVYGSALREYKVSFADWDGQVMHWELHFYGDPIWFDHDNIEYISKLFRRPNDSMFSYQFKGWDKEVDPYCHGEVTYRAVYEPKLLPGRENMTDWVQVDGKWYYFRSGEMVFGWQQIGGVWYYFQSSGVMQTGWLQDGGTWYYFNASGAMVTGWQQISGTWYYFQAGGKMQTGWLQIGGVWYYFQAGGKMQTGWLQIGGTWYYFKSGGAMVTGWLQLGSTWYYFNASGAMVTGTVTINGKQNKFDASGAWLGEVSQNGWVQEGGKWYYYQNGAKATGWKQVSGKWYYFNTSGVMQTGWLQVGGTWYYFQSGGAMQTGWLKLGNIWYYFHSSGAMATGSVTIGGKVYYFNSSGACLNP